jgi:hypothetical protein
MQQTGKNSRFYIIYSVTEWYIHFAFSSCMIIADCCMAQFTSDRLLLPLLVAIDRGPSFYFFVLLRFIIGARVARFILVNYTKMWGKYTKWP